MDPDQEIHLLSAFGARLGRTAIPKASNDLSAVSMSYTISRDNTAGDNFRNDCLLEEWGQKRQRHLLDKQVSMPSTQQQKSASELGQTDKDYAESYAETISPDLLEISKLGPVIPVNPPTYQVSRTTHVVPAQTQLDPDSNMRSWFPPSTWKFFGSPGSHLSSPAAEREEDMWPSANAFSPHSGPVSPVTRSPSPRYVS
nr:C2H2 transcription factor [Colletotrichum truncatum]XP_036585087.1 C2H2 transcription factor [Colletotrichum truncatum]KAF6780565.1 C2H2 transcription factor [Colletotrichum truncatum]KAF6794855.1 C2H2 transcription factor [Colletotrichum truncatum]